MYWKMSSVAGCSVYISERLQISLFRRHVRSNHDETRERMVDPTDTRPINPAEPPNSTPGIAGGGITRNGGNLLDKIYWQLRISLLY